MVPVMSVRFNGFPSKYGWRKYISSLIIIDHFKGITKPLVVLAQPPTSRGMDMATALGSAVFVCALRFDGAFGAVVNVREPAHPVDSPL